MSLATAKEQVRNVFSQLGPESAASFLTWLENDFLPSSWGTANREPEPVVCPEVLSSIIEDLRVDIPLNSICQSEHMYYPSTGPNADVDPSRTLHVDAFLYDDDEIDRLCDEGKMSRSICRDCGSQNTEPLTFISHSMSVNQLRFIFSSALPTLTQNLGEKVIVDVGSRIGAVLYGAFCFSPAKKIIGVEMNQELCQLQEKIVSHYQMSNKIQVICSDICKQAALLQQADVVVLNNVFEFFLPVPDQIRVWKFLRENVSKKGCILISVPSIEEALQLGDDQMIIDDVEEWLQPLSVSYDTGTTEDDEEFSSIFFYRVV